MNSIIFEVVLVVVSTIVIVIGVGLLLALPIKWTWNVIMPYLFGLPVLSWGKAWCLYFLCGCLLKASNINSSSKK